MKKITGLGFACVLLVSPFLATGNVSAAETGKQLTEQYQINWDNAWENSDASNQSVDFGTSSNSQQISASGWGDLASGKTVLSATTKTVSSKGTTKGKILTTVTSATTSLKNISLGLTQNGSKKIAVGKLTATSETSIGRNSKSNVYTGLTIHTATDSGVLYDSKTTKSNAY
ncbi:MULTISPECIES: hypothetical protein [Priestia]|uniref:hypothetical protein n=1 Tax=Priestia TaxID=2800373 RepID=UPI0013F3CE6C|nr:MULTISPECIES: hypothetical protein [Priestia]UPK52769.1 hypothetical protein MT476_26795 [Bacillus sp. H8-1]MDT0150338.1 hypothetical protein [Priestia aryabhattai]MDT0155470.1 hypothetical protein [Priestia aryabhattai]NGY89783.1 hypothetical protein [Priestia megaterium]WDC91190.1 hypothetical protein PSR56_27760 [Priestia megaterium]